MPYVAALLTTLANDAGTSLNCVRVFADADVAGRVDAIAVPARVAAPSLRKSLRLMFIELCPQKGYVFHIIHYFTLKVYRFGQKKNTATLRSI